MSKVIRFTDHALLKMELLNKHGFKVDEELVRNVVAHSDRIDKGHRAGRVVAQKVIDADHILRVVYEEWVDYILIITMYPGRRKRYEKD
jgi:hypothetical protein